MQMIEVGTLKPSAISVITAAQPISLEANVLTECLAEDSFFVVKPSVPDIENSPACHWFDAAFSVTTDVLNADAK